MLKTPHLKYQPVYLYLRTLVLDPVPNFNTAPFGGAVDSCYLQVNTILFNQFSHKGSLKSYRNSDNQINILIYSFNSSLFINVFELNHMSLSGILFVEEIVSPVLRLILLFFLEKMLRSNFMSNQELTSSNRNSCRVKR